MRPERNPLDLNNLPEEYGDRYREGKQFSGESSVAATDSPIPPGNFQQRGGMGDPSLPFRSFYSRVPSPSSSSILSPQPPIQQYLYPSSTHLLSFPSPYPPPPPPPINDYYVGHVLNSNRHPNPNYATESNYTCIGAPIAHRYPSEGIRAPGADGAQCNHPQGANWNYNYTDEQELDRFRDEF